MTSANPIKLEDFFAYDKAIHKKWFITGASRGIGLSIVLAALAAGDTVFATARDTSALTGLAAEHPNRLHVGVLDVTQQDAATSSVAAAVQAMGGIDVVVNNAGYADICSIEDYNLDDFRRQVDVNFYGTLYVTQAAIPHLRKQGHGYFLQIATVGARLGAPGISAYNAAKWAVTGFSNALSQEVAPFGIKVTVVQPGGMRTDFAGSSMTDHPYGEQYKDTVGGFGGYLRGVSGKQANDPAKMADVLVALSRHDDPPLELLLGEDGYGICQEGAERRKRDDEKWYGVMASVKY